MLIQTLKAGEIINEALAKCSKAPAYIIMSEETYRILDDIFFPNGSPYPCMRRVFSQLYMVINEQEEKIPVAIDEALRLGEIVIC